MELNSTKFISLFFSFKRKTFLLKSTLNMLLYRYMQPKVYKLPIKVGRKQPLIIVLLIVKEVRL